MSIITAVKTMNHYMHVRETNAVSAVENDVPVAGVLACHISVSRPYASA